MSKYTPHTPSDIKKMLDTIGVESIDCLFSDIDKDIKRNEPLNLPEGISQFETLYQLKELAKRNTVYDTVLRGAGSYDHFIPPTLSALTSRSEFVTAYTPYQPEISQGILQSIFEYQSYMCALTGMDVSNASVYDGATACAEALTMVCDKKRKVVIAGAINPDYLDVIKTYASASNIETIILPAGENGLVEIEDLNNAITEDIAGVYVQNPNYFGLLENMEEIGNVVKEKKSKFIYIFNPISAVLLPTPQSVNADIAVGEGQPLGIPMSFGGPYLGIMTATSAMQRKMPGRIVGETVDKSGKRAFVLTLQAREQHIRREKASSSICSNQAHCALTATVYLSLMGEQLKEVASQCLTKAHYLKSNLENIPGIRVKYQGEFFHEFVIECEHNISKINKRLSREGILGGLPLDENTMLWCVTEKPTKEQLDTVIEIIKEVVL